MLKFLAAAVWICAATLGAVFYSFQAAGSHGDDAKPKPMLGGLDYVKTDIVSVPLVRDASVQGYFLTRLVYTVEPAQMKKLSVPAGAIITDEVYSYIYSHPQIDFRKTDTVDLGAFRAGIRDAVNARIGEKLVNEVLVDQIDFLTKDDIRDNARRVRKDIDPTATGTAAKGGGH